MVLVYKSSGILNFAQGAIGMFGAFAYYELRDQRGWSPAIAVLVGIAIAAAAGVVVEILVVLTMRKATALARVIATVGVMATLLGLFSERYHDTFLITKGFIPNGTITLPGDITLGQDRLWLLGIAVVVTLVLAVVYTVTRFGAATTAVAENEIATAALGWSPDRIALVNWGAAGGLAGFAAILLGPIGGLSPTLLTLMVLYGMAAALVGKFSSFPLTLAGGLIIGVAESEIGRYSTTPGVASAAPFIVILVLLLVRGRALPLRGELFERAQRVGNGAVRPVVALVGAAITLVLIWTVMPVSWVDATTTTMITAMLALSLVVVTGYAGQLSFAQLSLAGIGGWAAAQLVAKHGWPFEAALVAGALAAVPVGLCVALPALRVRGANLALATLGLSVVLVNVVLSSERIAPTVRIGEARLFGIDIGAIDHPERFATAVLGFLALSMIVVSNVRRGRTGRKLLAVRTNERGAAALGVSVFAAKLYAFALAGVIAGLGGVLTAYRFPNANIHSFTVLGGINLVVFAVIGGIGYVFGAVLAGMAVPGGVGSQLIHDLGFTNINKWLTILAGVGLLIVLHQDPNGQAHLMVRRWRRHLSRLSPRRHVDAPVVDSDDAVTVAPRVLEVRDLAVRFGGVVAVGGVSFRVEPGEVVGLIGPNGSGKTTVLDAITGFVSYTGSVSVDGAPLEGWSPSRRARAGIGRSFQSLELFDDLTVRENLQAAADSRGAWSYLTDCARPAHSPLRGAAARSVHEFELVALLDEEPTNLPYGMRRLVAIARAMAAEPSVLLLDEPAAGLDERQATELGTLIRALAQSWGVGVLLVEHHVDLVMSICDRVLALESGGLIAEGSPAQIRVDPAVVEAYLGEPDPATDSSA